MKDQYLDYVEYFQNSALKNSPVIKWAKDMNRHYIDKNIQMVNQNMKRCSTSLIIREMQIKLTVRYTYTL